MRFRTTDHLGDKVRRTQKSPRVRHHFGRQLKALISTVKQRSQRHGVHNYLNVSQAPVAVERSCVTVLVSMMMFASLGDFGAWRFLFVTKEPVEEKLASGVDRMSRLSRALFDNMEKPPTT